MFGRLPWLAFERRMRAFFFLVFFDIRVKAYSVHCRLNQPSQATAPPANY